MSRKREYLADAGSVELTKNPDAMIGALRKIAGHSEISAPAQVQEMFLDHPRASGLGGLVRDPPVDRRSRRRPGPVRRRPRDHRPCESPPVVGESPDPPEFGRRLRPPEPGSAATGAEPPAGPWGRPQG